MIETDDDNDKDDVSLQEGTIVLPNNVADHLPNTFLIPCFSEASQKPKDIDEIVLLPSFKTNWMNMAYAIVQQQKYPLPSDS